MSDQLLIHTDSGVMTLTLNRPELHNAFDDALINELNQVLDAIHFNHNIKVVVLRANGKSFSAGADLHWMQRMAHFSEDENLQDAKKLAELMFRLYNLNKPTLAIVQGAAFGGGVGLVAACDIAIATDDASFCLSEVKLGLIPAVISPYVIAAIGARSARRYFLTAEKFSAQQALKLGLVHEITSSQNLKTTLDDFIQLLLQNGPIAIHEAKKLIDYISQHELNQAVINKTAKWIAKLRLSPEGQEGLRAFLEKRKPLWRSSNV